MLYVFGIWLGTMTIYLAHSKITKKKYKVKYFDVTKDVKRFKKIKERINTNNSIFK